MSYIRTKDGVYELVDNLYQYHNGVEKFWYAKEENGKTLAIEITANKILNQSENLEELCDEFIYVSKQNEDYEKNEKPIIAITRKLTSLIKIANATNSVVLGAIWTDKGLIYVAKMNENGKLELI